MTTIIPTNAIPITMHTGKAAVRMSAQTIGKKKRKTRISHNCQG
ncbi:MAG: hypothetical protein OK439_01695 [Thaumarchaeota archaeon]|nr:hypothetical protein [Nitrososphaerota archaeon]